MKTIDLTGLNGRELTVIHNTFNPDEKVGKFKSNEIGIEKVSALIVEKNKGKNKAKFATQVALLPLSILAVLAPAIGVAKDLSTKVYPAHQFMLKALQELGGNEVHVQKDLLATDGVSVGADDAKFATTLEELYKLNLVVWEEDDGLMLTEVANNFTHANLMEIDMTVPFAELSISKPKEAKVPKEPTENSGKKHTPDSHFITPLIDTNPCQPGKGRAASYEIWLGKTAESRVTVGEYKSSGGGMFDLLDAVKRGRITIDEA